MENEKDYTRENNYSLLKKKLATGIVTFYHANLLLLPQSIKMNKNKYSTILLSNIYNYLRIKSYQYKDYIESEISPLLTEDGICLSRYHFSALKKQDQNDLAQYYKKK